MPGDEQIQSWLLWGPNGVGRDQAVALGWLRKPRDGVGDQIGYLGLTLAPTGLYVNPRRMVI